MGVVGRDCFFREFIGVVNICENETGKDILERAEI